MKISDKFQKIYLEMINQDNNVQSEVINQSLTKNLGIAALAGLSLLSPMEINGATPTNSQSQKVSSKVIKNIKLTPDQDFVARVIYSQTSTLCTGEEIIAIGKIIQNRVGKKDFGNCKTAVDVCKYPGAFSSVSKHNVNWNQFFPELNKWTKFDSRLAKILVSPIHRIEGSDWMKDIVYYHDKSIKKPSSWDNKYYTAVLVKETKNFKFYKIKAKKSTPKKVAKKQQSAQNKKG